MTRIGTDDFVVKEPIARSAVGIPQIVEGPAEALPSLGRPAEHGGCDGDAGARRL